MTVFEFRVPLVVDIYPLNGNTCVVCTCAQYIYVALTNRVCAIINALVAHGTAVLIASS